MAMVLYSLLLGAVLAAGAPVWGWRMLRHRRYRAGLQQRLGAVPAAVVAAVHGRRVVWVHAVSVGEVLAAERLVRELGTALGPGWVVIVSTTTETGQEVACARFGAERVFYWPLDFGWIVDRFLRAVNPELVVLVESELWPGMLERCRRAGILVAVVNARMSDRSFGRARRLPGLWRWMTRGVGTFLAQGEETAARLRALGAADVRVPGNLKYDLVQGGAGPLVDTLRSLVQGRTLVVAGSTLPGEESLLLEAWPAVLERDPGAILLLAPRHTNRFAEVDHFLRAAGRQVVRASSFTVSQDDLSPGALILLDTVGDLAGVYAVATVAFVGGSLVPRGGHNPLEAARFGVPVVMGPSYENFREVVNGMRRAEAVRIVQPEELPATLVTLLEDDGGMGKRGRAIFQAQSGATARTVATLREMLHA